MEINEDKYFGCVYLTTNNINGMKYIGKLIFKRKNDWNKYLGSGTYIKRALKKYGKENFSKEIVFLALDEEELNETEELYIKFCDAVNSKEYYNIKASSIGGDCYTNSPTRDKRRKEHSDKMKGSNNPMYGVKKTKTMIDSVVKANSKQVIIDDIVYSSMSDYARKSSIGFSTVHYRINSNSFPNYKYAENKS